MEYTVECRIDKNVVIVKMRGRLNFQVAEKFSREAVKIAKQNHCAKFLLDHTETEMQSGVNKLHAAGEELQQFGFTNSDRIAILVTDISHNPMIQETVNQNSRWSVVKYFSVVDSEEAMNWLFEDDKKIVSEII